ncbi:MAG: DUF4292 domain-containing protein [Bacteroidetes bacterium]|nr:DUF4292 domain-containing protein [Bacteroidota bacterium]
MSRPLLLLFFAGLFAGCAATSYYVDLSGVTAESVTEEIKSQSNSIHFFSTSGYGSFETKDGAYTASFDMSIDRPSSAIVNLYGPFGIKVAQVRLTEDTLLVYNTMRNELFMGKPTSTNLRRLLMIASNGTSFTDLLLDLMPPVGNLDSARFTRQLDGDAVNFTYANEDTVEQYTVDGKFMRTREYKKSVNGQTVMKIQYSGFEQIGRVCVPRRVSFEDMQHGVSARLYYQDTSLNQRKNVEFSVPSDAKEVILN